MLVNTGCGQLVYALIYILCNQTLASETDLCTSLLNYLGKGLGCTYLNFLTTSPHNALNIWVSDVGRDLKVYKLGNKTV